MEASKEKWVNSEDYKGEGRTLCNHSIPSMVFGANPFFFEGFNIEVNNTDLKILCFFSFHYNINITTPF